jgi:type II secretory pathway pseudopilin PulG
MPNSQVSGRSVTSPTRNPIWRAAQRGFVLIETLVAVGIIGTAVLGSMIAVSTASRVTSEVEEKVTAQWVAASYVDWIRGAPYVVVPGTYVPNPAIAVPVGYTVQIATSNYTTLPPASFQRVTVTVSKGGVPVLTTRFLKAD